MTPATIGKFNGETYLTMDGLTIATDQILAVHMGGVGYNPSIRTFSGADIPITLEQAQEVNRALREQITAESQASSPSPTFEEFIRRNSDALMVDGTARGAIVRDFMTYHGINVRRLRY